MPNEPTQTQGYARLIALMLYLCEHKAKPSTIRVAINAYKSYNNEESAERVIRRDIEALRKIDIAVAQNKDGEYFIDSENMVIPTTLSSEEVKMLFLLSVPQLSNENFTMKPALRTGLMKLAKFYTPSLNERKLIESDLEEFYASYFNEQDLVEEELEALDDATGLHAFAQAIPQANIMAERKMSNVLDTIRGALHNKKQVEITYTNYQGEESKRVIEPHYFYVTNGKLCVHAYCTLKNAERNFYLTSVGKAKALNSSFTHPKSESAELIRQPPFAFGDDEPFDVILLIEPVAQYAATLAQDYAKSDELETREDGCLLWHTQATSVQSLFSWTIQYGPGVFVYEPAWAKNACMDILRKMGGEA